MTPQPIPSPRYVWFFIGWYKDDWFKNQAYLTEDQIECTRWRSRPVVWWQNLKKWLPGTR